MLGGATFFLFFQCEECCCSMLVSPRVLADEGESSTPSWTSWWVVHCVEKALGRAAASRGVHGLSQTCRGQESASNTEMPNTAVWRRLEGDHGAWELLWAKGGEGLANDGPDGPWPREKASSAGSIKGSAGTGMGHLIGVAIGIALWLRRSQLLICQRGAATKPSQELAA